MTRPSRGQLVLAAAAVAALAFVPVLAAYLQFGYAGDVHAATGHADPGRDARHVLDRAVDRATPGLPAEYAWAERSATATAFRAGVADRSRGLDTPPDAGGGPVFTVTWNASAARDWTAANCPGGRGRAFGDCSTDRGVVLQNRGGRTHVVAAAFDVSAAATEGSSSFTLVLRRR